MALKSRYKRGKGAVQKKKPRKEGIFRAVKGVAERYLSFLSEDHWLKLFLVDLPPKFVKLLRGLILIKQPQPSTCHSGNRHLCVTPCFVLCSMVAICQPLQSYYCYMWCFPAVEENKK